MTLGLTGGIGSGKSTVAALLAARGACVVDADAIARAVTAAGGAAIAPIAAAFGPGFIDTAGALNRNAMRALVHRDAQARQRLEAIVHPLVMQESRRQAQAAQATGSPLVVFDIPLLAESGPRWRRLVDRVLVVDCEPETQIARVMQRNAWPREQIEGILAAQASRSARLAVADAVLFNGAGVTLERLQQQVENWAQRLPL